jgi:hypothetical protein
MHAEMNKPAEPSRSIHEMSHEQSSELALPYRVTVFCSWYGDQHASRLRKANMYLILAFLGHARVALGSFATEPTGPICHLMSASTSESDRRQL